MKSERSSRRFNLGASLLLVLMGARVALATTLEMDFRHEDNRTLPDSIQQTIIFDQAQTWGGYSAGVRFTEESVAVDRLGYFGEVRYVPFSFLNFSVRAVQKVRIEDQSGATTWMATMGLCAPFGQSSFCFTLGPTHRLLQMDKRAWIPILYRSAAAEWDLAARFDLTVQWTDTWSTRATLGSFENLNIYNLHNPFVQVTLSGKALLGSADLFLFGRYHALLGFGTIDNWTTGVGFRWSSF